jgi:hypothetical protein
MIPGKLASSPAAVIPDVGRYLFEWRGISAFRPEDPGSGSLKPSRCRRSEPNRLLQGVFTNDLVTRLRLGPALASRAPPLVRDDQNGAMRLSLDWIRVFVSLR